jgi:GT2 family glycosyltransferase
VRKALELETAIKKLCVIIPSRNRAQSLKRLIESLNEARCPEQASVEIVAVNNGSTDETAEMLIEQSVRRRCFPLRIFNQPQPGKSNALNMALANCDGDVLLILDDDVVVDPLCLVRHIQTYRSTKFAAVQGRILPGRDPEGRTADSSRFREYNIPYIDYGEETREIRGLTGTNMSFKREVFEKVGFFDSRLGPGALGFSEDTEYSIRIRNAGFTIGYTPEAIVYHELNPNRYGRAYNRDVEFRKGLSRSLYRQDSIAFKVIPNLLANCLRWVGYRLLGKTQKAYKTEGRVLKCLGYLAGKFRRRTGPQARARS